MADPGIRVLLVEDHEMVAQSFVTLLAAEADIEVLGVAPDVASARRDAAALRPDVILMDYHLPDGNGIESAKDIKAIVPDVRIIILTGSSDERILPAAIEAGCSGFLAKTRGIDELIAAVRSAHDGNAVIPEAMLGRLVSAPQATGSDLGGDLSEREREVLTLLAEGLATKAIAEQLYLSVHTVRNHIQRILMKLDAHSKLEAVAVALREGIVTVQ
jgi:DNA-binding NarL/FixJ family response regulator